MIGFRQMGDVVIADYVMSRLVAEAAETFGNLALQCRVTLGVFVRDAVAKVDHRIEVSSVHAVDEPIKQAERRGATLGRGITAVVDVGNNGDAGNHALSPRRGACGAVPVSALLLFRSTHASVAS